jgi:tungsten cofactor oxidoreducase radical SAM maturase
MNNTVNNLKKLYLEITNQCNLDCIICYRKNWNGCGSQLSLPLIEELTEQLKSLPHLKQIVIGGVGEPTIHNDFATISQRLSNYELSLTTNAYYWNDEHLETMVKYYQNIVVSIDGLPSTFETIRGFSFDILKTNLSRLVELKKKLNSKTPKIYAQLVLSKLNVDEVFPLLAMLRSMGVAHLNLSNLLPQDNESKDQIIYTKHDNAKMKQFSLELCNLRYIHGVPVSEPRYELKTERWCEFIEKSTAFINSDGNVAACYRFAHPSIEYVFSREKTVYPFFYGNIKNQPLEEIWNSHDYRDLRIQNYTNRFPSCPDCDLVDCCDYINTSQMDCLGHYPSCADCLWTRGFIICF